MLKPYLSHDYDLRLKGIYFIDSVKKEMQEINWQACTEKIDRGTGC